MNGCALAASGTDGSWAAILAVGILLAGAGIALLVTARGRGGRATAAIVLCLAIAAGGSAGAAPAEAATGCASPEPPAPTTPACADETCVTPQTPVSTPVCGAEPQVTIPEQAGVDYVETRAGSVLTVTAAPSEGYVFTADATTQWSFDLSPTTVDPWPVPEIDTIVVRMGMPFGPFPYNGMAWPGDPDTEAWIAAAYPVYRIEPADGLTVEFIVEDQELSEEIVWWGTVAGSPPVELYRQVVASQFSGDLSYDRFDQESFLIGWIPEPPYDWAITEITADLQTANPDAVITALTSESDPPTTEAEFPPGLVHGEMTFDPGPGCALESRTIPVVVTPSFIP